jgi:hypothetical protein
MALSKKSFSSHWENIPATGLTSVLVADSQLYSPSKYMTGLNIILFCSPLTLVNNAVIIRFPEHNFQNVSNNHIAPTCYTWVTTSIAQFT